MMTRKIKAQYTKGGARIMTGPEVKQGFVDLLNRLDATTAWLMAMQAAVEAGQVIDDSKLEQMIADNMALLEQFKKKETKQ
jgi:hypothetical protein